MGLSHFEDTASDGVTSWEEGGRELPTRTSFTESVCSQQPEAQEVIEPPPHLPVPRPHLAVGTGRGKSVPVGRESHAVDKAAVVLQETGRLSRDRQLGKALHEL